MKNTKKSTSKVNIPKIQFKGMDYLFSKNTKISNLKKCNIFFGRNSSGKSSISRYIKNNYSKKFNVKIFNQNKSKKLIKKDYNLNALLLGEDNQNIDHKVNECEDAIKQKEKILSEKKSDLNSRDREYTTKRNSLNKWYRTNAKVLKKRNLAHFNKTGFKNLAIKLYKSNQIYTLSQEKQAEYSKIISESDKSNLPTKTTLPDIKINFIKLNIHNLSNSINKYINSKNYSIDKKKKFAIVGTKIHKSGDNCAFCGNKITSTRLKQLKHMALSNTYNDIKTKINYLYNFIYKEQNILNNYNINISSNNFYLPYITPAKELINKIIEICKQYNKFFEYLLLLLDNEKSSLSLINLDLKSPNISFNKLQHEINILNKKNSKYKDYKKSKSLIIKKKLLYDAVSNMDLSFNLRNQIRQFKKILQKRQSKQKEIQELRTQIRSLNDDEEQLLERTKSTKLAAKRINTYLSRLGDKSFKLHYIKKNKEEYYQVTDINDNPRKIKHLSSGELNLISFFYFYYSLSPNKSNKDSKKNIIIFDDPMDSNDEDFQYLMIDMLEELFYKIYNKENDPKYKKYKNDQLFIFTHNINFYINLMNDLGYKHVNAYHLNKYGNHTKISYIKSNKYDYHNEYQELWKFVIFLYHCDKPNFMLNPIRRIIETFTQFNSININEFYSKYTGAKKELNVNSHALNDINITPLKHSYQAMEILRTLFKRNGYLNHFRRYISKFNTQYKEINNSQP